MAHPTALRGTCVTVPRAMTGNKAVRGMNGLSQLPAMLRSKGRTDCIEWRDVGSSLHTHQFATSMGWKHPSPVYGDTICWQSALQCLWTLPVCCWWTSRHMNADQYCATLKGRRVAIRTKRPVCLASVILHVITTDRPTARHSRFGTRCKNLIFVVPCIMLYNGEISPTRCNNCVFFSAMALLYMFRVTISPIIRSTYAVYGRR